MCLYSYKAEVWSNSHKAACVYILMKQQCVYIIMKQKFFHILRVFLFLWSGIC